MRLGCSILEGYGLTETSAGTCVNRPTLYKFGTVGLPFDGSEIKIADDGEILIKGPGVMEGYHNNPEATAEALTDGWFHTGDIGELDADGYVRITDRKKDLFKTSGGKYIAPQIIEGQFKAVCPYASQVVIHGNERNFVSALVTLDPDTIVGWADQNGLAGKEYVEIVTSDRGARHGAERHRRAQRQAEPVGDDQALRHPRARPHRRGRRDHARA